MSDGKPMIQIFQDEIEAVVRRYYDQGLTLGEAVGALEVVKLDLWRNQRDEPDEENMP